MLNPSQHLLLLIISRIMVATRNMARKLQFSSPSSSEYDDDFETMDETLSVGDLSVDDGDDGDDGDVTDEMFEVMSQHQISAVSDMSTVLLSSPMKTYFSKVASLTPSIKDILSNPGVKDKDKIKLCEIYAIMAQYEPFSWNWVEARTALKNRVRKAKESASTSHDQLRRLKQATAQPLKERIALLQASDSVKIAIFQKYREMNTYTPGAEEYAKLHTWIQFVLSVPFRIQKPILYDSIESFLFAAKQRLDCELYGMSKVKEQILLFLNKRLMNPDAKGCTLGLVGEKGVGKTAIIRSLANILDIPFEQLSCGGITNPDTMIGHSFTYIGAKCGMIVNALTKMKCRNGILFFDEFDKIKNPDVLNAMLHITDPGQNHEFTDQFLGQDVPIDLSNLWMVFAMNSLPESEPLTDRMYTIKVDGYSQQDKVNILRQFMLQRICSNSGLKPTDIVIDEDVASSLVDRVSPSSVKGVRSVEKALSDLVNKISFMVNTKNTTSEFKTSFTSTLSTAPLSYPVRVSRAMLNRLLDADLIVETPMSFKMIYM